MHGISGNADGFIALYDMLDDPQLIYVTPEGKYPFSINIEFLLVTVIRMVLLTLKRDVIWPLYLRKMAMMSLFMNLKGVIKLLQQFLIQQLNGSWLDLMI